MSARAFPTGARFYDLGQKLGVLRARMKSPRPPPAYKPRSDWRGRMEWIELTHVLMARSISPGSTWFSVERTLGLSAKKMTSRAAAALNKQAVQPRFAPLMGIIAGVKPMQRLSGSCTSHYAHWSMTAPLG